MTEEQAKDKWCPATGLNKCLGTDCMAWVGTKDNGRCGMVNYGPRLTPGPRQTRDPKKVARLKALFDEARKAYPGKKRGLDTEWDHFRRHKDWEREVYHLKPAIDILIRWREDCRRSGEFVHPWKNFKTWTHNRCWEEALSV